MFQIFLVSNQIFIDFTYKRCKGNIIAVTDLMDSSSPFR